MKKRFTYTVFFVLFLTYFSCAQGYNYRHYDIKDGLAGLMVYSAVQDKEGFMWFATENGLSRFDGSHFKNFTKTDGLPDNEIIKLFVDSKNRVWILPFTNSVCYYQNGKIYTQDEDSGLKKVHLNFPPYGLTEDRKGSIAITDEMNINIVNTDNSVYAISEIDDKKFTIISQGTDINGDFNFSIEARGQEGVYTVQNRRLMQKQMIAGKYNNFRNQVLLINGNLIFKKGNQYHIQTANAEKDIVFPVPVKFSSLSLLSDSTFTINTIDTIFLFNIKNRKITHKFSIGKTVNSCFRDNENNYWFATNGYGLYRLASVAFHDYKFFEGQNALPVYALFKERNFIWAGTNESLLWRINTKNQSLTKQAIYKGNFSSVRLNNITKNKSGKFILGTVFNNQSVKHIYQYHDSLLISSSGGVYQMATDDIDQVDTIWNYRATCAYKFDDLFYIGTLTGLYLVDFNMRIIDPGRQESLLKSRISGMVQSIDGTIWIGTYDNGILGYKNGKIIKHITQNDGLSSNGCRVLSLYNNELWAGTDKGINKIEVNGKSIAVTAYSFKDGLNCDIINCLIIENDTVYAGTSYGLTIFNPNDIDNNSICNLVITSFQSEKKFFTEAIGNTSFPPGDKSFQLDFTAISLKSEGNITYYYKLSSIDTGWQSTRQNTIRYASLAPGDYAVELYAINAFGKKSETQAISFSIEKYFYQQNWFVIFCIFITGGIIWGIVRKRIILIKKATSAKLQTQKRITELEQMALRSQMNPHFIFNCLNSIQQFIFEKDPKEANKFITDFASLIRQTLDLSDKKLISISDEIKYLSTYLSIEQSRFENKFSFSLTVDDNVDKTENIVPPLLLQPLIENCIRHGIRNLLGYGGEIIINFKNENSFLICTIEDNGIGRKAADQLKNMHSTEYHSKGLGLVQQRIDNLNAVNKIKIAMTISDKVSNDKPTGTVVTIKLPL